MPSKAWHPQTLEIKISYYRSTSISYSTIWKQILQVSNSHWVKIYIRKQKLISAQVSSKCLVSSVHMIQNLQCSL